MNQPLKLCTLTYLGWSGFLLRYPGANAVLFDPPDQKNIPKHEDVSILLTHGHPEHIAGTASYLSDQRRTGKADVFASPVVCRTLKRRNAKRTDQLHPCHPGRTYRIGEVSADVFLTHHMPLLPPERGEGLRRLAQVIGNPRLAASIVRDVIRFPLAGPLLGFRTSAPGWPRVLFYGEGLHRCTAREEVERVGTKLPNDLLITAVEPEDVDILPELIEAIRAPAVVPYEAHAPWRQGFGMPCADLGAFSSTLENRGYGVLRAVPDQRFSIAPA